MAIREVDGTGAEVVRAVAAEDTAAGECIAE
jgi:hypothetical protein